MFTGPYHEHTDIPDKTFPMNTFHCRMFPPHWHDHLEWVYVCRGATRVQLDGDFFDVVAGELIFINAKQVHSSIATVPGTELIAIVFNDALLRSSLDSTDSRYFGPLMNNRWQVPSVIKREDPLWADIRQSVLHVIDEFERSDAGFELFIKSEFYKLFGLMFRNAVTKLKKGEHPRQDTAYFTNLLTYLRDHFSESVSVCDAARMVNMSPNYFCKIFKKLTGKTLVEYMHILRVMEAERLLLNTNIPITTIAGEVGFSNATYFGRIFKKYKNQVPSDVRRIYAQHQAQQNSPMSQTSESLEFM